MQLKITSAVHNNNLIHLLDSFWENKSDLSELGRN